MLLFVSNEGDNGFDVLCRPEDWKEADRIVRASVERHGVALLEPVFRRKREDFPGFRIRYRYVESQDEGVGTAIGKDIRRNAEPGVPGMKGKRGPGGFAAFKFNERFRVGANGGRAPRGGSPRTT